MTIISFNLKNVVFNIPTGENSHGVFIQFSDMGLKSQGICNLLKKMFA